MEKRNNDRSLRVLVENAAAIALAENGLPAELGRSSDCPRPEAGDLSISAALAAAKILRKPPMEIARILAERMTMELAEIAKVEVAHPGYVNVRFTDEAIAAALVDSENSALGIPAAKTPQTIVLDFGGPNIKPMHVGHLRSLVIGESLRRILSAVGHSVVSDIHLGDWGLPLGMILSEIKLRVPEAPWFTGADEFPDALPLSAEAMAVIYPEAAADCKVDPERMAIARAATADLQAGNQALRHLHGLVVRDAKVGILAACDRLGAHFDLLLGESDAQPEIPAILAELEAAGIAERDGDALVAKVALENDSRPMPPLTLAKADGSALYATTDLATIRARARDIKPDAILYVVDGRQDLHFEQTFRVARAAGLAGDAKLEHVPFGTVNGPDGRPFKTRDGGAMRLEALLDLARDAAKRRIEDGERMPEATEAERDAAAEAIGLAALKIAELSSDRSSGYILDVERALSFEGRTGPRLLYSVVRIRSILRKAGLVPEGTRPAVGHPAERRLALAALDMGKAVAKAAERRAPHELVASAFDVADAIGRLYAELPIIACEDPDERAARLALVASAGRRLEKALELLGLVIPQAM
jgi:arginyl-tRNA synthetase